MPGRKTALAGLALNTLGSVLDVADLASMSTTLAVVGAGATVGLLPLALPIIARKYRKRAVKDGHEPKEYLTKLQQVAPMPVILQPHPKLKLPAVLMLPLIEPHLL